MRHRYHLVSAPSEGYRKGHHCCLQVLVLSLTGKINVSPFVWGANCSAMCALEAVRSALETTVGCSPLKTSYPLEDYRDALTSVVSCTYPNTARPSKYTLQGPAKVSSLRRKERNSIIQYLYNSHTFIRGRYSGYCPHPSRSPTRTISECGRFLDIRQVIRL